jgi:predicted dehydrogenase
MVGLQGQMSPVIHKVKELIEEGVLGKILSSSLSLAGSVGGGATREGAEYLDDVQTGGNLLTIPLGHLYDSISLVIGELQSLSATTSTQHHTVDVLASGGGLGELKGKPLKTVQRTSADQVSFSGLLESGAQSSVTAYGGQPFPGEPHLIWRLEGEKGVLDIRGDSTFAISMSGNVVIRLHDYESGEVKDIEHGQEPTGPVGNVGRLYEAYADGRYVPNWEHAVRRHAWVEAIQRSSANGRREAYMQ